MPLKTTAKTIAMAAALAALPMTASTAFASDGEAVYNKACKVCHDRGMAGAPKVGDAADWKNRLAQGMDTLYTHAIKGFKGEKGMMPPKGGNSKLSDDEVKAAVDYMLENSK